MPLSIIVPAASTMPFPARYCAIPPREGRFANARYFGTTLLRLENTGPQPVRPLSIRIDGRDEESDTFIVYGPTRNATIPAGDSIPLGIAFARWKDRVKAAKATLIVQWRESTSRRAPISLASRTLHCDLFGEHDSAADTRFVPSDVEMVASTVSKTSLIKLLCQRDTSVIQASGLPAGSAFSGVAPVGQFKPGGSPPLQLSFSAARTANKAPQVLTVEVGAQEVPVICWVADTVAPGQVELSALPEELNPPSGDLADESVTIRNTTDRTVDLGGCMLTDEGRREPGTGYYIPSPFPLPGRASVKVHTGRGHNSATDLYQRRRAPIWNNDIDTALLFNAAGDEVAKLAYAFGPRGFRVPRQFLAFDVPVAVAKVVGMGATGFTVEDGDVVVFDPDLMSTIFTGDLLRGHTGPGGIAEVAPAAEPDSPAWRLPGAPMFSLLAEAGGRPLFIGASRTTAAVRRTQGPFRSGTPLNLWINDNNPGAVGGSGFFVCRVRVFRR